MKYQRCQDFCLEVDYGFHKVYLLIIHTKWKVEVAYCTVVYSISVAAQKGLQKKKIAYILHTYYVQFSNHAKREEEEENWYDQVVWQMSQDHKCNRLEKLSKY